MPRSRAELLRLHLLHRAAAAAFEAELKNRAAEIFDAERSADTWRLDLGLVTTNVNQPRAVVTDMEALLDYLEQHTAAVHRREVREVPEEFLKGFLGSLSPHVEWDDEEEQARYGKPGETFMVKIQDDVVPGVRYTTGGTLASVSIRLDSEAKRMANLSVEAYVAGEADQPF